MCARMGTRTHTHSKTGLFQVFLCSQSEFQQVSYLLRWPKQSFLNECQNEFRSIPVFSSSALCGCWRFPLTFIICNLSTRLDLKQSLSSRHGPLYHHFCRINTVGSRQSESIILTRRVIFFLCWSGTGGLQNDQVAVSLFSSAEILLCAQREFFPPNQGRSLFLHSGGNNSARRVLEVRVRGATLTSIL